jgi:hypothetical protein
VTLTMARAGFPASLSALDPAADPRLLAAFARGVDIAALALTAIVSVVLAILVVWAWRARARPPRSAGLAIPPSRSDTPLPERTPGPSA